MLNGEGKMVIRLTELIKMEMSKEAFYTVMRLEEFLLCDKYQDVIKTVDNGLIVLSIIHDELEKE